MVDTAKPASFIPHDTSVAPTPRRHMGGGLNDLLLLCAVVLCIASIALAVGVFLYGQYLATEGAAKLAQLERAKTAFQPALVQQLTRLDDRMHSADRVLSTHIAPSLFFKALEQATLKTVSFQTLDFQGADSQNLAIKMAGIAQGVNSIALQADLFSKNGVITNPIFSNIARQADGVHFNLSAIVSPAAINYVSQLVNAGGVSGEGAVPAPTQQTPSSPFEGSGAAAPNTSGTPPAQTQSTSTPRP